VGGAGVRFTSAGTWEDPDDRTAGGLGAAFDGLPARGGLEEGRCWPSAGAANGDVKRVAVVGSVLVAAVVRLVIAWRFHPPAAGWAGAPATVTWAWEELVSGSAAAGDRLIAAQVPVPMTVRAA
jgi:hypothetical protein